MDYGLQGEKNTMGKLMRLKKMNLIRKEKKNKNV